MNELKKESKDKHKSEKSHRNSESKTSKASKKEGEEGKVNKEHKHKDKSSDKSKSKHKDNSEPKEEKSKVKVEVEKSKPNVAENPVLRLSSKSPSKQLLRISTENLAPSQDRTQENSPREYVVRRGLPESDSPQPLTKNNSSPNLLSDQEAENVPKSPQGIILRSFSSGKQDNVVNGDVNSSSTIASTSVPSASRIRIVGNRPAVKQNNVYYSCPTKKLMENPPPKTSSSRYDISNLFCFYFFTSSST